MSTLENFQRATTQKGEDPLNLWYSSVEKIEACGSDFREGELGKDHFPKTIAVAAES